MEASHLITYKYSKNNIFQLRDVPCINILKDILRMKHFQVAITSTQS